MSEKKTKETRLMKVTMDAEDFDKFDKGETYSNKGIRNSQGKLSALPDIAPVSEDDLPRKTVVPPKIEYYQPKQPSIGKMMMQDLKYSLFSMAKNKIIDTITDPRKLTATWNKLKQLWEDYAVPILFIDDESQPNHHRTAREVLESARPEVNNTSVSISNSKANDRRITVTSEQADQMVIAVKQKAREITAMIFVLSHIVIKDEKTDEESSIEENYIKALLEKETTQTMKELLDQKQLLDKNEAIRIDDWLHGYIRNGDQRIPIPIQYNDQKG